MKLISRLAQCNLKMQDIAIKKEDTEAVNNKLRKNNTFWNKLPSVFIILESYKLGKNYLSYQFTDEIRIKLKLIKEELEKNFSSLDVISISNILKADSLIDEMKKEWTLFMEAQNNEILEKLRILELISNNKGEINNLQNAITNSSKWFPSVAKMDRYNDKLIEAKNYTETINFDPEIEEFLRKASNGKATILDLNDKIINWIKIQGLEGNIHITI